MAKTRKNTNKKHTTSKSKSPLRSIEANNLNEDLESRGMHAEITGGKRKPISNRVNVPIEANNLNEDLESQGAHNKIIGGKRKPISKHTSIKKKRVNEESSFLPNNDDEHTSDDLFDDSLNASSPSIRNESSSSQRLLIFRTSSSHLLRSSSPEELYDRRSLTSKVASSSLIKDYSFQNTDNQQPPISNVTNTSTSQIGPFKSDLELCIYLVEHPNLINLTLNMMKANGQEPATTQGKVVDRFSALPERDLSTLLMHLKCLFFCTRIMNKQIVDTLMNSLFPNVQRIGASEHAALQKWVSGCFRDYNASLRWELRKLVPEFIRKYKLTKAKRPTIQQFSEYITEKNWSAFLKRHMDATDVQKMFRDQPENVDKFSNFIRSAFDLFIQEDLLDKDVVIEFKNLNHLTVDMNIFTANGKDSLQKLDLRSLLKLD
ncbi:hypothetical protein C2G38_2140581 [Gigaspora rosea]|uniref:Uncharacterized protein n=1 Tax=Gigaspora rosea TaxID=44941 RepID=A0A397VJU0_9GLOM|nr:hypothetical protein C2G38_2140581 [Gigaspora rosea]